MKDIIPAKKQSPILGLTGMGGGVGGNLGGSLAKSPYIEDVFSTYLYEGTNGSKVAATGVDMTKGGMVWWKNRTGSSTQNILIDTVRGENKVINSDSNGAEFTGNYSQTFTSTGWTLNNGFGDINNGSNYYTSWNFRKQEGFFDVVTFNETGSPHADFTVSHSLGCIPGMIILKRTDDTSNWWVWHKYDPTGLLRLNTAQANTDMTNDWCIPTSTNFTFRPTYVGAMGAASWVAYLFAGGESTADTARSVDLDASGDYLDVVASSDFSFGSGDFTVEGWFKVDSTSAAQTIIGVWDYQNNQRSWLVEANNSGGLLFSVSNNGSSTTDVVGSNCVSTGVWTHFAAVRDGDNLKLFVNGTQVATSSYSMNIYANSSDKCFIGLLNGATNKLTGKLSNIRVVKGTAVYTSSFKPPTEPLTNITNTKLLCCNNASVTGSTVTPGTIDATGDPTASTDSPFDDPEGYKFGEEGDQNIVKCGSYVGNGSSDGPEINLGWEPQFLLFKNSNASNENWRIYDSMRGWVTGGDDLTLLPNTQDAEVTNQNFASITSTGFKVVSSDAAINTNGNKIIYMAIRRPDPLVGKPPAAGTDVFAMDDTYNGSNVFPQFTSGFPVDFSLTRDPDVTGTWQSWHTGARLLQERYQLTATNNTWASGGNFKYDYNDGIFEGTWTDYMSWMWKRHAGFDVVTWNGDAQAGRKILHNLSKTPEMIWVKCRNSAEDWQVGHKGLNGGTNPWEYSVRLNRDYAQQDTSNRWNDTAPTSTEFTVGGPGEVNGNTGTYIGMLFASVDGISKCGYYSGDGSANLTITTGFQPRFILIKKSSGPSSWHLFDSVRGMGGTDKLLQLNSDAAQLDVNYVTVSSTGWNTEGTSLTNGNYIYYAHA